VTRPDPSQLPATRQDDWPAPAADEISLFDLWEVLLRRRGLLALVFGACVGLALLYGLARPEAFQYSAAVSAGRVPGDGGFAPVQSAQALRVEAEEAHIPAVLRSEQVPEELRGQTTITASLPDSGDLVVLRAEGPAARSELYLGLLQAVAERLAGAYREPFEAASTGLHERIRELEQAREIELARASEAGARLQAIEARQEALQGQIIDLRERLEAAPQAPALQQALNRALELRDLVLPERFRQAQAERYQAERAAAQALREIQTSRSQLSALRPVGLLDPPSRSLRPAGPGLAVILALGAVLGAMLAVFAAFGAEFVRRAAVAAGRG